MSPELDGALCQKFPQIFAERNHSMTVTAMCWGFVVKDGWYLLLDVLCEELQRDTDQRGEPQVVASQVKEKFGGLRFYVHAASARQRAMINLAQALSFRICEECGCPASLDHHGGWTRTRCSLHREA